MAAGLPLPKAPPSPPAERSFPEPGAVPPVAPPAALAPAAEPAPTPPLPPVCAVIVELSGAALSAARGPPDEDTEILLPGASWPVAELRPLLLPAKISLR